MGMYSTRSHDHQKAHLDEKQILRNEYRNVSETWKDLCRAASHPPRQKTVVPILDSPTNPAFRMLLPRWSSTLFGTGGTAPDIASSAPKIVDTKSTATFAISGWNVNE